MSCCLAIVSNCAASADPSASQLTINSPNACDATPTDATCSAFTCGDGFNGGLLTCLGDTSWAVVDCTPDGTCDGINPSGSFFTVTANACDGTVTNATCTNFVCTDGYEGGTLTCLDTGYWNEVDCTGACNLMQTNMTRDKFVIFGLLVRCFFKKTGKKK